MEYGGCNEERILRRVTVQNEAYDARPTFIAQTRTLMVQRGVHFEHRYIIISTAN